MPTRLDHPLMYEAAKLATGANAHSLYSYLHRYRTAKNPKMRARYERILRKLVRIGNHMASRRTYMDFLRSESKLI